jgi:Thymidylate kinase
MIVAFEGKHGSGKSTLLNKLAKWIELNINAPLTITL